MKLKDRVKQLEAELSGLREKADDLEQRKNAFAKAWERSCHDCAALSDRLTGVELERDKLGADVERLMNIVNWICEPAKEKDGGKFSAPKEYDCGVLTPSSPVPRIRKLAGKRMGEIPIGFCDYLWEKAGYGAFGERRGWQGRIADYLESHHGFWQERRPKWAYEKGDSEEQEISNP